MNDEAVNKKDKCIALAYDRLQEIAPKIIAKGEGAFAKKIIEIATQKNIATTEDKELVEILSLLEVDSVIPVETYETVAEILNYVYRLDKMQS